MLVPRGMQTPFGQIINQIGLPSLVWHLRSFKFKILTYNHMFLSSNALLSQARNPPPTVRSKVRKLTRQVVENECLAQGHENHSNTLLLMLKKREGGVFTVMRPMMKIKQSSPPSFCSMHPLATKELCHTHFYMKPSGSLASSRWFACRIHPEV